jgi:hypothetical protein
VQWTKVGHAPGDFWTITVINNIIDKIELKQMKETPENIRGITERSLLIQCLYAII